MTALSPSYFPSSEDMENFASEYLGLTGTDTDLYYESYFQLNNDAVEDLYEEVEYRNDELNQTHWEY